MAELKGSKTENNLMEAFAGESQANRKYLAFAEKADAEVPCFTSEREKVSGLLQQVVQGLCAHVVVGCRTEEHDTLHDRTIRLENDHGELGFFYSIDRH